MEKKYDVVALGELLIDFIRTGTSAYGNPVFEANPGGAPCNVLAMLARLGHKVAFIGKVGKDMFGDQLEGAIAEAGIDTIGLTRDSKVDFSFYRNPGADMMLGVEDINEDIVQRCKVFHFGTLSMTAAGCREATKKAIALAKDAGALISFDPNIREPLWDSPDLAKEQTVYGITQCDVLKIADNEIRWLTGKEDFTEGVEEIRKIHKIPLILVSMGREGSRAYYKEDMVEVKSFLQENTIETTGAGDTFCANVISFVLKHGLDNLTKDRLKEMLTFANAAAAIVTTRKGALKVMPSWEEIEALAKMRL